jgi:hypothetical protein
MAVLSFQDGVGHPNVGCQFEVKKVGQKKSVIARGLITDFVFCV